MNKIRGIYYAFALRMNPLFSLIDFERKSRLKKLCAAIARDNYGIELNSADNTLERLNELLNKPEFYEIAIKNKAKIISSNRNKTVKCLIDKTKEGRRKKYIELDYVETSAIQRLNRLLLEIIYLRICPKLWERKPFTGTKSIAASLKISPSYVSKIRHKFLGTISRKELFAILGEDYKLRDEIIKNSGLLSKISDRYYLARSGYRANILSLMDKEEFHDKQDELTKLLSLIDKKEKTRKWVLNQKRAGSNNKKGRAASLTEAQLKSIVRIMSPFYFSRDFRRKRWDRQYLLEQIDEDNLGIVLKKPEGSTQRLNELLEKNDLYNKYLGIGRISELPYEIQELIPKEEGLPKTVKLNRLLLEYLYPETCPKSRDKVVDLSVKKFQKLIQAKFNVKLGIRRCQQLFRDKISSSLV